MKAPDPYAPAGPSGVLIVPNTLVRLLWPAVREWAVDRHDAGAVEVLEAAGPLLRRWEVMATTQQVSADGHAAFQSDGRWAPSRHESEWLTTTEAADRLGCSPRTIRRKADSGALEARRLDGGRWLVSSRSVDLFERITT